MTITLKSVYGFDVIVLKPLEDDYMGRAYLVTYPIEDYTDKYALIKYWANELKEN